MNRFQYLKNIKNHENFIGMDGFLKDHVGFSSRSLDRKFSPLKDFFDIFYISLLLGLKKNKKIDLKDKNIETGDMTQNWIDGLDQHKEIIVALYVSSVIEKQDENYTDKKKVQNILNKKIGNNPQRSISNEGMEEMHEYAFGGYIELLKLFNNYKPANLLDFFQKINEEIIINQ